jgi:hypothetical protein
VRSILAFCAILAAIAGARGQDQEQKLVNRLLKPSTTLQNSAQNKKFTSAGASVNKRASVGTFYLRQKPAEKTFADVRSVSVRDFNSRSFYNGSDKPRLSSQQLTPKSGSAYSTSSATGIGGAHDSSKATKTRDFSGNRPFLDKGKSQKSLNRENPPMTIEQVRELLNKNK